MDFDQIRERADPSRICGSAVLGILLWGGGLALGGWNEYRNVATQRTISLGRDFHKPVACSPISADMDGKLVHLACPLTGHEVLGESEIGVPSGVRGIELTDTLEAYQWVQERSGEDRDGNAKYTWVQRWSSSYEEGRGPGGASTSTTTTTTGSSSGSTTTTTTTTGARVNPPLNTRTWYTSDLTLGTSTVDAAAALKVGDFDFPDGLLSSVLDYTPVTPTCSATTAAVACPNGVAAGGQYLYYRYNYNTAGTDEVGDLRRSFTLGTADFASVLAEQQKSTLVPWESPYDADYTIFLAAGSEQTADELFTAAEEANESLTWLLRVGTFFFTCFGMYCVFSPIAELAELVPCIGPMLSGLVSTVLCAVSCLAGFMCWLVVVGCTWVIYRPWIGIPLLLAAIGIGTFLVCFRANHISAQQNKMEQNGGQPMVPLNVNGGPVYDNGGAFNNGGGGFNNGGGFSPPPPGMNFCPNCGQMKPEEVPVCNKCAGF